MTGGGLEHELESVGVIVALLLQQLLGERGEVVAVVGLLLGELPHLGLSLPQGAEEAVGHRAELVVGALGLLDVAQGGLLSLGLVDARHSVRVAAHRAELLELRERGLYALVPLHPLSLDHHLGRGELRPF
jgi:hypothetical protein